ncbi:FapA family protein [Virgibacillus salarius]|uniref:FapA family protein n=1 Tax=Virgibacillus salarius TaxID=447199 RepID=UPI0031E71F7F
MQIQPVFEVEETLSMKNGNLDFVGTIIIHGDVPTGYTVKAKGDVKIFGMVEAATVIAGGSVYVSEGLAGQAKGTIRADESIKIGYINQGIAVAGQDLYVENSILHSNCTVKGHVFCQKGNIIGGALSAGKSIEAKDIGNRLSTETEIIFGVDKSIETKERQLQEKKKELEDTLSKLRILGEKIKQRDIEQNPKLRITLLRQKNSWNKTNEQLEEVTLQLDKLNSSIGSEHYAELIVRNYIFSNVIVAFGKYRRIIKDNQHFVKMHLVDNEIVIYPLFE